MGQATLTRARTMLTTATLTIWLYDTAMGAAAGEIRLKDLQRRGGVRVVDAVTVTWVPGADRPHIGHLMRRGPATATKGTALGALVGSLFMVPVVGDVAGAGVAGLADKLRDTGIDRAFLDEAISRVTPGTSALLVLSQEADLDVVRDFVERGIARGDVALMHVRLRDGASEALRQLLDPDRIPGRRGTSPLLARDPADGRH
jgi:uncharacterized membrane protein